MLSDILICTFFPPKLSPSVVTHSWYQTDMTLMFTHYRVRPLALEKQSLHCLKESDPIESHGNYFFISIFRIRGAYSSHHMGVAWSLYFFRSQSWSYINLCCLVVGYGSIVASPVKTVGFLRWIMYQEDTKSHVPCTGKQRNLRGVNCFVRPTSRDRQQLIIMKSLQCLLILAKHCNAALDNN